MNTEPKVIKEKHQNGDLPVSENTGSSENKNEGKKDSTSKIILIKF